MTIRRTLDTLMVVPNAFRLVPSELSTFMQERLIKRIHRLDKKAKNVSIFFSRCATNNLGLCSRYPGRRNGEKVSSAIKINLIWIRFDFTMLVGIQYLSKFVLSCAEPSSEIVCSGVEEIPIAHTFLMFNFTMCGYKICLYVVCIVR